MEAKSPNRKWGHNSATLWCIKTKLGSWTRDPVLRKSQTFSLVWPLGDTAISKHVFRWCVCLRKIISCLVIPWEVPKQFGSIIDAAAILDFIKKFARSWRNLPQMIFGPSLIKSIRRIFDVQSFVQDNRMKPPNKTCGQISVTLQCLDARLGI